MWVFGTWRKEGKDTVLRDGWPKGGSGSGMRNVLVQGDRRWWYDETSENRTEASVFLGGRASDI